jgi:hypothetical protein
MNRAGLSGHLVSLRYALKQPAEAPPLSPDNRLKNWHDFHDFLVKDTVCVWRNERLIDEDRKAQSADKSDIHEAKDYPQNPPFRSQVPSHLGLVRYGIHQTLNGPLRIYFRRARRSGENPRPNCEENRCIQPLCRRDAVSYEKRGYRSLLGLLHRKGRRT